MTSQWGALRLGDVTRKIGSGATPTGGKEAYLDSGPFALIRSQNVYNDRFAFPGLAYINDDQAKSLNNVTVEANDVLLNITGDSVARCAQVDPSALPARVNQHVAIIRPDSSYLDARFLHYYLVSPGVQQHLHQLASAGATRPALTKSMLESLILVAPFSVNEQRAIASVLGALDDKIELNRKMSATLEAMARAIFTSWFVDFDPVRAKADGRSAGLAPEIVALFPDSLQESEYDEIPRGWNVGNLGDVSVNERRGLSHHDISDHTPYIGLDHMPRRCVALDRWDDSEGLESNKSVFRRGEILFGKLRPYFHKVGIAPIDGVCSTDILVVAPKMPEWDSFVLGHITSDALIAHTDQCSTGTRMPRASWSHIAEFSVILPSSEVAVAYNAIVSPMMARIIANIHESRTLSALRDVLLPKLISGELRVSEAERNLEMSA